MQVCDRQQSGAVGDINLREGSCSPQGAISSIKEELKMAKADELRTQISIKYLCAHAHSHTHISMHTQPDTHTDTHIHLLLLKKTKPLTFHTYTCTVRHTLTHMHVHTHIHTHTHLHQTKTPITGVQTGPHNRRSDYPTESPRHSRYPEQCRQSLCF